MKRCELLSESKQKRIFSTANPNEVLIQFKAILTAEDGIKRDIIPETDIHNNVINACCFELLASAGTPTHFIRKIDNNSFLARACWPIDLEIVVRRQATGSFLQRNPGIKEGAHFEDLLVELFYKNDPLHDPIVHWDNGELLLYDAHKPQLPETFIEKLALEKVGLQRKQDLQILKGLAKMCFVILEEAWAEQGVILVDYKMEAGYDAVLKHALVCDSIDNGCWRIWPQGKKELRKDKDNFRYDLKSKEDLRKDYAWVAKACQKFPL